MTEQDKRDLQADLALCEAATKGPVRWRSYGRQYMLEGEYGSRPIPLSATWEETEEGHVVKDSIALAVRDADGMLQPLTPEHPDARRIEASWEGWPHAIRRAMEAEARVKELEELLSEALEAIGGLAKETGYGSPLVDDPRDFTPDLECCSDQEVAAWSDACARVERGETVEIPPHIWGPGYRLWYNPWGVGTSIIRNPEMCALRDRLREALTPNEGLVAVEELEEAEKHGPD